MNQKFKQSRGITLIALVITIIVLLILAGVTISMVLGDEGIIAQAQQAKEKQEQEAKKEQADLENLGAEAEAIIAQTTEGTATWYALNSDDNKALKHRHYVNYSYTPKTYKAEANKTGTTKDGDLNQTFDSAGTAKIERWRVLNITEKGVITLIGENPTEVKLALDGAKGYFNGVDILNEMCKTLYSGEYGTARSINLDDIQTVIKKVGLSESSTGIDKLGYYYTDKNGVLKKYEEGMTIGDIEKQESITLGNTKTPDGSNYKNYKLNYYYLDYNSGEEALETSSSLFSIILNKFDSESYWIANNCCNLTLNKDVARFGIYNMRDYMIGNTALLKSNGDTPYSEDGKYKSFKILPVVQLKAGTKIEKIDSNGDGTIDVNDSTWEILAD